ncbi:MAG: hypothetical protein U0169_10100 [Polyangiaceae bacterium]
MYSRTFSWGVRAPAVHSVGKRLVDVTASETWKSLKRTRPHCALPDPTGVFHVMCWTLGRALVAVVVVEIHFCVGATTASTS